MCDHVRCSAHQSNPFVQILSDGWKRESHGLSAKGTWKESRGPLRLAVISYFPRKFRSLDASFLAHFEPKYGRLPFTLK